MENTENVFKKCSKKVGNGYEGDFCDLPETAKSARLIAYYGCIFIDSVEETWDWKNEKKIEEIKEFVKVLVKNINKHLEEDKQQHVYDLEDE